MRTLLITLAIVFSVHSMLDNFIQDSKIAKTIAERNTNIKIALGGVR